MEQDSPASRRIAERQRAATVFLAFLRLGVTSFGGPLVHIGCFQAATDKLEPGSRKSRASVTGIKRHEEAKHEPAQDRIKVGLDLPTSDRTGLGWSELRDIAMLAEEVGFDSIWLDDHLLYHMRGAAEPNGNWESWSMLSALAACTKTVELGNLVLGMGFRNPALLAKMADTVDEISGGRLILGVGTGYHEVEYNAFGYPYDHRYARFEEAIQIVSALLKTGEVDFDGQYYKARECLLKPRGPRPTARRSWSARKATRCSG